MFFQQTNKIFICQEAFAKFRKQRDFERFFDENMLQDQQKGLLKNLSDKVFSRIFIDYLTKLINHMNKEAFAKLRARRSFGSFSVGAKKCKKVTLRRLPFLHFFAPTEKSLKIPLFSEFCKCL